jgi:hypothetical protein
MSVASVRRRCAASSLPPSQVSERRSYIGNRRILTASACATVSALRSGTLTISRKREWRSTRVAMWVL